MYVVNSSDGRCLVAVRLIVGVRYLERPLREVLLYSKFYSRIISADLLSDGEVMERLWSFLRHFSRMTKEMRPSHRTDILCHALIYYGHKTKQNLGIEHYYHNIIILFAYLTINKHI